MLSPWELATFAAQINLLRAAKAAPNPRPEPSRSAATCAVTLTSAKDL
jgi:hypothetical protein